MMAKISLQHTSGGGFLGALLGRIPMCRPTGTGHPCPARGKSSHGLGQILLLYWHSRELRRQSDYFVRTKPSRELRHSIRTQ